MTVELFGQEGQHSQVTPENESAYEVLVGDGKKFKDNEALARAKLESDSFIEQLKRELAGTRQELATRVNMEDFLRQMEEEKKARSEPVTHTSDQVATTVTPISDEHIIAKVNAVLNQTQQESEAQRNVQYVREELIRTYGTNYEAKVLTKAQELGVTKEWLQDIAQRTPKAFLELVGVNAPQARPDPNVAVPPRSSHVPSSHQSGVKNKAYYDKMKRDNPVLYWSADVQLEEYKAAMKLGEAFYN